MRDAILLDPVADPRWLDFVNGHKLAGIFHHPAWLSMLSATYGYKSLAVCLQQNGHVTAGIPFVEVKSYITGQRWVSVPFSDHCRPLLGSSAEEDLQELLAYLQKQLDRVVSKIEVRWGTESSIPLHREGTFFLHLLSLQKDSEAVFGTFKKTQVQQPIQKAIREGVRVKECESLAEFMAFYDLQLQTRRRLGVPAQPKRFFNAIWDYLIQAGFGFALIALKDEQAIGGAVFLRFGSTVTYKYAASDHAFRSMKPNDLVLWEAIRRACNMGCTTFDFGRTEKSNEGLRKFKSGWGTTEHNLDYTILSKSPPKGRSSSVRNLVGGIIKHSPRFVCRLSGELFYKHFA